MLVFVQLIVCNCCYVLYTVHYLCNLFDWLCLYFCDYNFIYWTKVVIERYFNLHKLTFYLYF